MNPAILKALVEALKQGKRLLGHTPKQAATKAGTRVKGVGRVPEEAKTPMWRGRAPKSGTSGPRPMTHGEVGQPPALPMGRANQLLYGLPKNKKWGYARAAGLLGAGAVGTNMIGSALFGGEDEVAADDAKAYRPQFGASTPEWNAGSEVQSRVKFQQSQDAKFNRQMKKLLLNYGIVNLVNPDSGEEMLKIGMAILKQDLEASGDARKAEIFDSVFTPGNMPKTAKTAYERVLKAGGTPADAAEISGAYVDMRPPATSQKKEDVAAQVIASVQQLLAVGQDSQARNLLRQYIMSNHIGRAQDSSGIEQPINIQVDEWMKMLGGGGARPRNPGGITIDG